MRIPVPFALISFLLAPALCIGADQSPTRADLDRRLDKDQYRRKRVVEKMDKEKLIARTTAVTVQSEEMLKVPKIAGDVSGISVAKTAPAMDFLIVPVNPRFFFDTPAGGGGLWVDWGQGTYHNGKYYGSIGNHIFYDSRLHVMMYDPKTRTITMSPELNTLAGLPIDYGDGKIHGSVDFFGGDTMYFMSYWTEYPEPKEELWQKGYEGGRLMSYNFSTGKFRDFGCPLKRVSWPYHRMDRKRGLMYGVGSEGEFMVWDVKKEKMLYGGFPPNGMLWCSRALIVDEETGCAYTSNASRTDNDIHILKYDSDRNRFSLMKSTTAKTPDSKAFEADYIRANTPRKLPDGSFICITRAGRMFKFFPAEDRTEDLGSCWPAPSEKLYTTSIAMSPDSKYIYYIPGAHGNSQELGCPVVQYNTQTREKKALAFLFPYLQDRYGYVCGGSYSLDMDEKGERLFMWMNGAFSNWSEKAGGDTMGDVSLMVLHIPESERG